MQNKQMLWLLALTRNVDICIYSNITLSNPSKTILNLSIRFDLSLYFAAHNRSITETQKASSHTSLLQRSKHCFLQKMQNCTLLYLTFCIPEFMFIPHSRLLSVWFLSDYALCLEISEIASKFRFSQNPLLVASFFCLSLYIFFPFSWLSYCLLICHLMVDWLYIDCSNFTHLYRYYWICPVSCCVFIAICK